jgi:hypothetical protein
LERLNGIIEELRRKEENGIENTLRKQITDLNFALDLKNTELLEKANQLRQF